MGLELRTQQNQILNQRMIQSVRILQMTSPELESYIDELALENPAMDVEKPEEESVDAREMKILIQDQENYTYMRQNNDDDYDPPGERNLRAPDSETLREYLLSQLDLRRLSQEEQRILRYLLKASMSGDISRRRRPLWRVSSE